MNDVPEVLFVCVHNAGRSQMAAALLDHHARGRVHVRSAGSEPADRLNPAVVEAMAEIGLDISQQFPKPLTDEAARTADVLITMGCGDACPVFPGKRYLDWDLTDPAGLPIEQVRSIRDDIDRHVQDLFTQLMSDRDDIRETVRQRYANAARQFAAGEHEEARAAEAPGCGTATPSTSDPQGRVVFGADLYDPADAREPAVAASLGCGVPTAVADLHPGETVLDLGSGAGADVLISARRVAPGGRAIGLDMTVEMLDLARRNAAASGVTNVEFLHGYLEDVPLPDDSVDVVLSNCVINLSTDKNLVLQEAARVLRPGGRVAISDVVADLDMDDATRADMAEWTGCIAGALTEQEYRTALKAAGLIDIEINETHRVHPSASSAIIRARKPAGER